MTRSQRAGALLLTLIALAAIFAPWIAPHRAGEQLPDRAYAPPTRIHFLEPGGLHGPFMRRVELVDRPRRVYREDPSTHIPLSGLRSPVPDQPVLLFGADPLGRDIFSRVVLGARWSLGVALAGAFGAILIGALVGGLAGSMGGRVDAALMFVADFVIVLPAVYLVLVLRSLLPLVLSTAETFALMAALFALAGWPHVARGVRAVVSVERRRDYAEAARAAGAGPWRVMMHLLPATRSFLQAELVLLVPALLAAEAAISFLGLGFPEPTASWGTMLQDAANVRVMTDAPWMLAPAAALFLVVLALQLLGTRATFFDNVRTQAPNVTTPSS
jgi:peptide/nickel transport system permease protein